MLMFSRQKPTGLLATSKIHFFVFFTLLVALLDGLDLQFRYDTANVVFLGHVPNPFGTAFLLFLSWRKSLGCPLCNRVGRGMTLVVSAEAP